MKPSENPKNPANQLFNIKGKPGKKIGWWNPKSPNYWRIKK